MLSAAVSKENVNEDEQLPSRAQILRLLVTEKSDPAPFYEKLAALTISEMNVPFADRMVLDLGCGTGQNSQALRQAGANVVAMDLEQHLAHATSQLGTPALSGVATNLPFASQSFDGIFCSNVLEHVPSVPDMVDEIARILKPGGWAWVSWTNWWSPWGGHNIVPLHLLGPKVGPRVWNKLFGPPPKNVPGEGLFPTYIGQTLRLVQDHPALHLIDARPRYYPNHRWILKVPGFREFATWNCVMTIERAA